MKIFCFSHLRWNFVYQRPQHLLSRAGASFPVFYIEEPVFGPQQDRLEIREAGNQVNVVVPYLNESGDRRDITSSIRELLNKWEELDGTPFIAWFYTPMALDLLDAFPEPALIVYDCMDELSAFRFAPAGLKEKEQVLISRADIIFTGGVSLYEAKKHLHDIIYAVPSSIDKEHFSKAQTVKNEPGDQLNIPHPRIGFFGVIDERLDIDIIGELARRRPDWQLVLVGPTVKIDPATLPAENNIHYLGSKSYDELPVYLGGWDVAIIPFAINESTEFISPTKTPEYLAGGIPVVSTPIRDVVNPYGVNGLVSIASNAAEFEEAVSGALQLKENSGWKNQVKEFLADMSWDNTWNNMLQKITRLLENKSTISTKKKEGLHV
ncbi:MAG: glycosyltransferase family 1 protein [Chitinophagaceae bacterium]